MTWINEFINHLYSTNREDIQIEKAFQLKFNNLPEKIYKYREINKNSLRNLREDTIWLADPNSFNDPYDCHHFVNLQSMMSELIKDHTSSLMSSIPKHLVPEAKEALRKSEDPIDTLIGFICSDKSPEEIKTIKSTLKKVRLDQFEQFSKAGDKLKHGMRLCSFSTRVDSTLMWAHYADYHKGFCVEYDIKSLPSSDHRTRFMFPVVYQDNVFDATKGMSNVRTENFNNLHLNLAALIKSTDWSYEKEWRLVFTNGLIKDPQAYNMPTPKAVYLGSHIGPKNEAKVREICSRKGIPVFKMKHSRSSFNMTSEAVE